MRKSLSKKSEKVIKKHLEEFKQCSSLGELTRVGARMMLEVALQLDKVLKEDRAKVKESFYKYPYGIGRG